MGIDTMKKFKTIFPIAVAFLFVLIIGFLLFVGAVKTDTAKYIRAIGYPKDTIMTGNKELLVVEMHDFVKDTIYFDTIVRNNRIPSTLEDYDPKFRNYRKRKLEAY